MEFQLLISTMKQTDHALVERLNVCADAVIINQCGKNAREVFQKDGHTILWIDTDERGLSKSRNMALRNASADICLLVDDDEVLLDSCGEDIVQTFKQYPDASIIRFQVKGIEREYKVYSPEPSKLNFRTGAKISSVEMAVRRRDILENGIWFDELIGAGTQLLCGEENAFVAACLRKRLNAYYVPVLVSHMHMYEGVSSWYTGVNPEYFRARGAALVAMSPRFGKLLILRFALTHRDLASEMGFWKMLSYMMEGAGVYRRKKRELGKSA